MFPSTTRILLVDDMSTERRISELHLKQLGFTTFFEAPNGAVAYDSLCSQLEAGKPIELVICDWNMPVLDGLELLRKIRASASFNGLPFLMLTGNEDAPQIIKALKSGANNYIVKPATAESFDKKLKEIWAKIHP